MHSTLKTIQDFKVEHRKATFCVVGGGLAGICAALEAARNGVHTILVQDRAVLGGNASSEVRMWIAQAFGEENKSGGILEEIQLRNLYYNADLKYTIWDDVLYGICREEPLLDLQLSCSVTEVHSCDRKISSIRSWHMTRQCWIDIEADYFADCSGDSVLRACGAETRQGRECKHEFNESHAPDEADDKTMGNSILMQLREVDEHHPFVAPPWAVKYKEEDLPNRPLKPGKGDNFWWLELGGIMDTIDDADKIRDENLAIAYGVWDLMKNHPDGRGHNWELEWVGSLPGKRENIRYVGDHILTQNDIEAEGRFEDRICHGGWPMDDHHPEAINHKGKPTIFYPAPSPYGIPYRCLYSKDMDNLFCAGRNISTTHMALSSTRIMGTTALLGQAVGAAVVIAKRHQLSTRGVYQHKIQELQQLLMDDDQFIPWMQRPFQAQQCGASLSVSQGDTQELLNGLERNLKDQDHGWWCQTGDHLTWTFPEAQSISGVRLVVDSDFNVDRRVPCSFPKKGNRSGIPKLLLKSGLIEGQTPDGKWVELKNFDNNFTRLIKPRFECQKLKAVRFTPQSSWGSDKLHIFSFDVTVAP